MRYQLEGEDWLPKYEAKKEYQVTVEQLTHAVNDGTLRWRTYTNPHNYKEFRLYNVEDLEELFGKKEAQRVEGEDSW
jgi:ribosomal protein L32E